jgi:hypothetical protein
MRKEKKQSLIASLSSQKYKSINHRTLLRSLSIGLTVPYLSVRVPTGTTSTGNGGETYYSLHSNIYKHDDDHYLTDTRGYKIKAEPEHPTNTIINLSMTRIF